MSHTIEDLVAKPESFGFRWSLETVRVDGRGDKGVAFKDTPIVVVTDYAKFEASFPGTVLAALNGQSIRVGSQRVSRDAREDGVKDANAIKIANAKWLLGLKAAVVTYKAADGAFYASEEAAQAASIAWAMAQVQGKQQGAGQKK